MKKQNLLIFLVLGLLLLSPKLIAESPKGRFSLKEGDWFEMRFDVPLNYADESTSPINFFTKPGKTELSVFLRYQLQKQRSNGNQIYNVSTQRIQSKMLASNFDVWLGYDSYYPPYEDDVKSAKPFVQFEMEVTPEGSISRFDSISGYIPSIKLTEISTRKKNRIDVTFDFDFPTPLIKVFSSFVVYLPSKQGSTTLFGSKIETNHYNETESYGIYQITTNDSIFSEIKYLKKERVLISDQLAHLVSASFPIAANTLIKGKLPNQLNQDITISLDGNKDESYFEKKTFKTNGDGSFTCPLFINSPLYLKMNIGDKTLSSFIAPNDTLEILDIPSKVERVSRIGTFYNHPSKQGYLLNADNFKGNAAANAKLSVEMQEWMSYMPLPEDIQAYLNYHKVITKKINELINQYSAKASETCIDYFRTEWNYYLAANKLYFSDEKEMKLFKDMLRADSNFEKETIDYPTDFFLEVDTLATVMPNYPWCQYYREFIEDAYKFRKNRLGMAIGGLDNNFYANYYFSRASLKGFPQYSALAKAINLELRKGFVSASKIEPFYQDFMANCKDPLLTEPLAEAHKTVSTLAIGNPFPVQSFILKDSTTFDLNNYKGKPVCLVVINGRYSRINDFKKDIEKFKPEEVEFLFILLHNAYMSHSPVDTSILAMPNVKVIDLVEQNLANQILLSKLNKVFMLDKWLRIAEDDVEDPSSSLGSDSLEKAVKKAIQAKRYTKAEKTGFYKIAGWSLGSTLFTFLIGLYLYRIRTRTIKQKEAAKRRIKELEIKAIRSQMNPHFIFNALNSIQSLVNSKQYKASNIYLSKFSVLLRSVLNNSERNMVTLSDELEAVRLYCELEQLRFEFDLTIEIASDIKHDLIEIPGMIIQPLVENAVVHGLSPIREKGRLTIRVTQCNGSICVYVTDNGAGLSQQKEDKLSQKGFGLKLVEERLAILSQKNKLAELTIENNSEGTGTTATLIIPID